jgi:hypothetical protein
MKLFIRFTKPLLLGLLLLASCERVNLDALYHDQVDTLSSVLEAEGKSMAPLTPIENQLSRLITYCNALIVVSLLAITGLVVYSE